MHISSLAVLVSVTFTPYALAQSAPQVQLGETTLIGKALPTFNEEFFGGV